MSIDGKSETKITVTALRENAELTRVNRRLRSLLQDHGIEVPSELNDDPLIDELAATRARLKEMTQLVQYWRSKCQPSS